MEIVTQSNPVYKGFIRWNRSHGETKTIKKEEEWIVKKGTHPPIIAEDLFEKAQERYKREYHPKNVRASASYKHWLSGMIKCSACGRSLSYSRIYKKDKNHSFFQCYGYNKKLCSVSHGISERKIVAIIFNSLREAVNTNRKYEWKKENKEKKVQKENPISLIQVQLEKLTKKEERIQEAYVDGIDTLEEYKRNKLLILKERKNLEQELESLSLSKNQNLSITERKQQISDIIMVMESDDFSNAEKNEAIRSIIEKIVYDKLNGTIQVFYHYSGNPE